MRTVPATVSQTPINDCVASDVGVHRWLGGTCAHPAAHGIPVDAIKRLQLNLRPVASIPRVISTVAGNGSQGFSGDGGSATSAQVSPSGVAVDTAGNLYFADFFNSVWHLNRDP
jgi:hypothetical protein